MVDMAGGEEAAKPAGSRRGEPGSGAVLVLLPTSKERNTNAFPLLCFLLLLLPHGVTVVVVVVFVCEQSSGPGMKKCGDGRTGRGRTGRVRAWLAGGEATLVLLVLERERARGRGRGRNNKEREKEE